MRLELICSGLTKLLVDNNYSPTTINFYKREWKKLNDFLITHNQQVNPIVEIILRINVKKIDTVISCFDNHLWNVGIQK